MTDYLDIAPFARVCFWTGESRHNLTRHDISAAAAGGWDFVPFDAPGSWQLGLEWSEPRDLRAVELTFASPPPHDCQLQYWRQNWPTPAPERYAGALRGWIGRDDAYHGQWTAARGEYGVAGERFYITFDPLDLAELGSSAATRLEEAEHYLAEFRRTLKVRFVCKSEAPPSVTQIKVFSTAQRSEQIVEVHDLQAEDTSQWKFEILNGAILSREDLASEVRLAVVCAQSATTNGDEALISTVSPSREFTFRVSDLAHSPIYIRDYDIYICCSGQPDPAAYLNSLAGRPADLYSRVSVEAEQTLARAFTEIPRLDVTNQEPFGRYVVLGIDGGRQEWGLRYNGELFADKRELKLLGRDAARLRWPGHQLRLRFGGGDPPDFRERAGATQQSLREGWLPVVESTWLDREIEYTQLAFAAPIAGAFRPVEEIVGTEDVAAFLRFTIRNTGRTRRRVDFWTVIAGQEELELRDGLLWACGRVVPAPPVQRQWRVNGYAEPYLRLAVSAPPIGTLKTVPYGDTSGALAVPCALHYGADLAGGASVTLDFVVPFPSVHSAAGLEAIRQAAFDERLRKTVSYWQNYIKDKGQLILPDTILADFHKAAQVHVAIAADKDPKSGLFVVPAAAWRYGACGNEACWQITMLDQAGHHARAAAYLETFLRTQGVIGPDGNFGSKEGAFQGLDIDDGTPISGHFGYNLDHGFIMECMANHYRLSREVEWLQRVAGQLVAACDFVIRERARTQQHDPVGRRVLEWGLLPPGHLEDNPEWRHWFAVNAHAYGGMQAIAAVLSEIDHPDAVRLAQEAANYRADIRTAALRCQALAPVERLRDGTSIPRIPTHTDIRGRELGWIRESAYGALHLLEAGVFEPWEPEITRLLQDLEDNLFVSPEWGRAVDEDKYWFSHGGITIQANLMDLAIDYLRRGEIKHALRALFNNFGASLYEDVRVFTEHPVIELGHGIGPFYKVSDESKALTWLRHHLLHEDGTCLHIARGAPEAWYAAGQEFGADAMATHFGPVSFRIASTPAQATAAVTLGSAALPQELVVAFRRPDTQIGDIIAEGADLLSVDHASGNVHLRAIEPVVRVAVALHPAGSLLPAD